MKQAYSYIRWSSEKQSLGDSERRQVDATEAYARKYDLTLAKTSYRDAGVSAFRGKNAAEGALSAFLVAVDDGTIVKGSMLLVESFDRLSRMPVMKALRLFQDIVDRGITLVTLKDGQVYNTASLDANWTQLIIALASMSGAHDENSRKSRHVKEAWDAKRKTGEILTAMGPAWLTLKTDAKGVRRWQVIKERADIVKAIFDLAAKGHGSPTLARLLNDSKTLTLGGIATEWSSGLVAAVLKNKSVIGTYTPKKAKADPVDNYYPQIISPLDFYRVQEHIAGRDKRGGIKGTNVANLFAGMTYCECGRRTRFVSGSKPHLYLRCLSAYGNTGCDAPTMPYTVIEGAIIQWLDKLSASVSHFTTAVTDPTLTTRSEIVEREGRLERLLDLAAESKSPGIAGRIEKLEAEIAALRKHLITAVPATPVQTALGIYAEHKKAARKGPAALTEHRLLLQSAIRRVITKVVLLKAEHNRALKNDPPQLVRELILEGSIVEPLRQWRNEDFQSATPGFGDVKPEDIYDSLVPVAPHMRDVGEGIVVPYEMPAKGFQAGNIRGRRRKA